MTMSVRNLNNPDEVINRKITQFMMHYCCVKEDELLVAVQNLIGGSEDLDLETLNSRINKINIKIKKYDLMIRRSMDEIDTNKYYVLISTVDNAITRAASNYNQKQLELFRQILITIVDEPQGTVSSVEIKRFATQLGLKNKEADHVLQEWIQSKWFVEVEEDVTGCITLGVRSTAELDVFIKSKLVDNPQNLLCHGCRHMSTYSSFCSSCDKRFHRRCFNIYADEQTKKCSTCQPKR